MQELNLDCLRSGGGGVYGDANKFEVQEIAAKYRHLVAGVEGDTLYFHPMTMENFRLTLQGIPLDTLQRDRKGFITERLETMYSLQELKELGSKAVWLKDGKGGIRVVNFSLWEQYLPLPTEKGEKFSLRTNEDDIAWIRQAFRGYAAAIATSGYVWWEVADSSAEALEKCAQEFARRFRFCPRPGCEYLFRDEEPPTYYEVVEGDRLFDPSRRHLGRDGGLVAYRSPDKPPKSPQPGEIWVCPRGEAFALRGIHRRTRNGRIEPWEYLQLREAENLPQWVVSEGEPLPGEGWLFYAVQSQR